MWIWFILVGVCLILELLTGTFYLLFLALGLLAGGVVSGLGFSIYIQIIAFITTSMLCIFGLRVFGMSKKGNGHHTGKNSSLNLDVGTLLSVTQWDSPRKTKVSYRGAQWQAILADSIPGDALPGDYIISDIQGLVLVLSPK